jgi:epoxyqueuosine reductase
MPDLEALLREIRTEAAGLGFSQIGVSAPSLERAAAALRLWLDAGRQGGMDYMRRHAELRAQPQTLVPGMLRVISARLDYLPDASGDWRGAEAARLADPRAATVSIYARGRDYHKVLRQRLQKLVDFIATRVDPGAVRVFTDSAPVFEVEIARQAGLGWRGKHTLLLRRDAGSMFFLGEIFIGLPLPVDAPQSAHCGSCRRCLDVCPTQAIVAPYALDARRCISYLTIEHEGAIPLDLRAAFGNRIYGCDDCQLVCPWNRYARTSPLPDFAPRQGLDGATLLQLWGWDEAEFLRRTEGSAIRRSGHARWRRNLAVALGNARRELAAADPAQGAIDAALRDALPLADALLAEHIGWALAQTPRV